MLRGLLLRVFRRRRKGRRPIESSALIFASLTRQETVGLSIRRDVGAHDVAARVDTACSGCGRTGNVERDVLLVPQHKSMERRGHPDSSAIEADDLAGAVDVPGLRNCAARHEQRRELADDERARVLDERARQQAPSELSRT